MLRISRIAAFIAPAPAMLYAVVFAVMARRAQRQQVLRFGTQRRRDLDRSAMMDMRGTAKPDQADTASRAFVAAIMQTLATYPSPFGTVVVSVMAGRISPVQYLTE
jgi:hypothetical protein